MMDEGETLMKRGDVLIQRATSHSGPTAATETARWHSSSSTPRSETPERSCSVTVWRSRRVRSGQQRVCRIQDRASAAMFTYDSVDADQGAEAYAADLAPAEEDHDDAAGLVGDDALERRISAPWLDAHGADAPRTRSAAERVFRRF